MANLHMGWNDHRDMFIRVPWWLGRADTDPARRRDLLLPIPFNFIYSIAIGTYVRLRMGWMTRKAERAAYEAGVKEGREIGELIGRDAGKDEFVSELARLMREQREANER